MYNENSAYPTKSNDVEVDRPDFGRILETLQKEAGNGFELTNTLTNLSNGIKNMETLPETNDVKEKSPNCLVEYLWAEIWKIQRSNRQLERVVAHLQKTIGS